MKYFISLFILLSSLLSASEIPQEVIDKHFDFCLSNAKKTEKQQVVCDKFWLPYGAGEGVSYDVLDDLRREYDFDPSSYKEEKLTGVCKLSFKQITITKKDEFGNDYTVKEKKYKYNLKKMLEGKTKTERELILVKNEAEIFNCINYNNQLINDNVIQRGLYLNQFLSMMIQSGKLPSSFSINLPETRTKNGHIETTIDIGGYFKRLMSYLAVKNKKTREKRLALIATFVSMNGYSIGLDKSTDFNKYGYVIYYMAKKGNGQAAQLIAIIANGKDKDISKYLMSIPGLNRYSEIFLKEWKKR